MTNKILVCGVDRTLVETRRAILEKAGYEAAVCTSETAEVRIHEKAEVDLVVFCSSLSHDQQLFLLGISHKERPGKKNLVVRVRLEDDREFPSTDIPFLAFDGPVRFLSKVTSLLAT